MRWAIKYCRQWFLTNFKRKWQLLFIVASSFILVHFVLHETVWKQYTPQNDFRVFEMLVDTTLPVQLRTNEKFESDAYEAQPIPPKQRKVLMCTMMTDNFASYAIGAGKLVQAVHKDIAPIQSQLNIFLELAVLEMQENPIPLNIWAYLKLAGWQQKITKPRIAPRTEGLAISSNFKDQFLKLHLWTMDTYGYEWVVYMDSDFFVLRSIIPLFQEILGSSAHQKQAPSGIWAVEDLPLFPGSFNAGLIIIQPDSREFQRFQCLLYGKCKDTMPIVFAEEWMEQGFLNAVYEKNWTHISPVHGMNLALWDANSDVWMQNATHLQIIHFTVMKPWSWPCVFTIFSPLCYIFWHKQDLSFHYVNDRDLHQQHSNKD